MTPGGTTRAVDERELLARFAELEEPNERRTLLGENPGLLSAENVRALCDWARSEIRGDLKGARRLSDAARTLAAELGEPLAIALGDRAAANVAHFGHDYASAQALYESAIERFRSAGDERQEAVTLSSGLQNLVYLGRYGEASRWYERGRATFERLGDRRRLARLEMNYGNVLHRQDLFDEAMRRYEAALENFLGTGESMDAAICLRNMAMCHVSLFRYQDALDCYANANELCREHGWDRLALENEYNIAYLYYYTADYARAIQMYQQVRVKFEESGDEHHQALCDLDLSEIFLELNLVDEAARLARWAYGAFDRLGMSYEAAKALSYLAVATSRQGRIFKAIETLAQAREMFVGEGNPVWPAQLDLYRATLLFLEGREFEAQSLAARARRDFLAVGLATRAAACRLLEARLALAQGDVERARSHSEEALEQLDEGGSAYRYQALFVRAKVLEATGDLDAALDSYRSAVRHLERLRSHLQTEELKVGMPEDRSEAYEALVALGLRAGATPEDRAASFAAMERAKARSIADLMAFRAHSLPARVATRSNLVEHIRALREELNWYYRQIDLQQMKLTNKALERLSRLRSESQLKESSLLHAVEELGVADRELASLQHAEPPALEELAAGLPRDTALLEYFFARGAVYAAVLGRRGLDVVPVTVVSRAREQHRLLQFQLSKFQLGPEFVDQYLDMIDADTRGHLGALFDELVAPIWPQLLEHDHLVVVPHGLLHYLPFHALWDGTRFMIDRFSLSYAPSAEVDGLCRQRLPSTATRSLIVAAAGRRQAVAEAETLAAVLPQARTLSGGRVDLDTLQEAARGCRFVHLATRARFRRDSPMFSTLELGEDQLSLGDLFQLELEADVVSLSGCGAGLDSTAPPDPLLGLARGLLYAGSRSLLVDLWDGPHEAGERLLRTFYGALARSESPASAHRTAMLELRERHPHPYFWARFACIGAPG